MRSIEHFINGQSVADSKRLSDVWNPSHGEVQAQVGLGTAATLQEDTLAQGRNHSSGDGVGGVDAEPFPADTEVA